MYKTVSQEAATLVRFPKGSTCSGKRKVVSCGTRENASPRTTRDTDCLQQVLAPESRGGNSFFSIVSETSIRAMNEMRHIGSSSKDMVVFLEGDTARGIYILYEGACKCPHGKP